MAFRVRGPGGLLLPEEAAPATPASGEGRLYAATDGTLHWLNDGGTDTTLGSGGGGSSPVLGSIYSNDAWGQANPASRATLAANGAYWVPIQIPFGATITGIRLRRGTGTTAANFLCAFYNAAGTRVATGASQAQGTTASAVLSNPFTGGPYAAAAGLYWACYVGAATTSVFMGWAVNEYLGPALYAAQGSFAAPASFTPPATSVLNAATVVPWLMTY